MSIRVITKFLAGIEDLLIGSGTTVQARASGNKAMTHIGGATLPYDNDPLFTIKDAIGSVIGGGISRLNIQNANFGKGSTAPAQVIIGNYTGWEYDINDDSVITIATPEDIDIALPLYIHLEWYCNEDYATNSGEVQWHLNWSAVPHDSSELVDAPMHTGTFSTGDIDIPTNAKGLTHTTTMQIAANNIIAEDVLGLTISRIGLVGGNNPTAKPTIVNAHLEYTKILAA